jgi:hypothetical protein
VTSFLEARYLLVKRADSRLCLVKQLCNDLCTSTSMRF